ncbi:energy transducer TonB [Pedobacter nototheniae]|uniref:energy transducer TonB n=1 Tax=Pedobacter nototheniae TaxID=2488994 RepID=UPI00103DB598|nr:energy transducer TonB [Pedobacter nototheniae]
MKNYFLTLLLILPALHNYAQKRQNVYFFKNDAPTADRKNYDYRRVITEPDSGATVFNLFEFYPDNTEKTIGFVSVFEPALVYEGTLKKFNDKGILIEKSYFKSGKPIGAASYFYQNGKPKSVILYDASVKIPGVSDHTFSKIVQAYDSLGTQMVKDGNGYYKTEDKFYAEEGNYINSEKDGVWKGRVGEGTFEEQYKNGNLITGIATLSNGKTNNYKNAEEFPTFPGGIQSFYSYLAREYKYPKEAVENRVSGRIFISFVVEKDGSLTDIKVRNHMGYGTEQEAIRVLNNCRKWIPAKQHGIPVRVAYNINFNLRAS